MTVQCAFWRRRVLLSPAKLVLFQANLFTRLEASAVSARRPRKRREIAKDWPEKLGADADPGRIMMALPKGREAQLPSTQSHE
jgi:hypothetical protein